MSFDYLFTASRLDGPKRVALLVEAMKFVKSDLEFRIAGEGSEEGRLKELAGGDSRIRFLGYRSDAELIADYARALAVAFVPYDEDYGLVTIEAMMSGKALLTVNDSGGPTEFVSHGKTGMCVENTPPEIAKAIDWLAEHREAASAMGKRARDEVKTITWQGTVSKLLASYSAVRRSCRARPLPRKLTVATTFHVTPVRGGGQARIVNFYKNLAPDIETTLITLCSERENPSRHEIAPGLTEIRIPKSTAHAEAEASISAEVQWFPVTDVVFPKLIHLTPRYLEALELSARASDVVVASHPYAAPFLATLAGKPLWYEAQDVEQALKRDVIPHTSMGLRLIEEVSNIERQCCEKAEKILTCSADDANQLACSYNIPSAKFVVVPNGVDTSHIRFVSRAECAQTRRELGMNGGRSAVFIGSWHAPNLQAVERVIDLAVRNPQVQFLILGGSCLAFGNVSNAPNLAFFGVVEDDIKTLVLQTADVALNPMTHGSGTNLKMLEYAAAGIPIVTTPEGARGLDFEDRSHVFVTDIGSFEERLIAALSTSATELQEMAWRTRKHTEVAFDWRSISRKFLQSI